MAQGAMSEAISEVHDSCDWFNSLFIWKYRDDVGAEPEKKKKEKSFSHFYFYVFVCYQRKNSGEI